MATSGTYASASGPSGERGPGWRVVGALKSRYARREVPIPLDLAYRRRSVVEGRPEGALVFPSAGGGPYDPHHLHQRVLIPACTEAGVEEAGFHTFRHTVASRLFAEGRNAVQVQRLARPPLAELHA